MPSTDEIATILRSSADKGNKPYFYSAERSDDGNICVHTSMPYSATIERNSQRRVHYLGAGVQQQPSGPL